MKKPLLTLFILLLALTGYSQSQERNFDFDAVHNGISVGWWTNFGSPNYGYP